MERAVLPLVAITRVVARPKSKGKNKTAPQREKAGIGWASRWSGVTVRGYSTGCSASRWSAMGVVVLTTQNHFRLDTDRPSHGSRDRKGAMRERRSAFEFALLRNFAQNGARRGPVPGPFGGARRTLCASKELAQNGVRRGPVPGPFGGARRTLCASWRARLSFRSPAFRYILDKLLRTHKMRAGTSQLTKNARVPVNPKERKDTANDRDSRWERRNNGGRPCPIHQTPALC